MIKLADSLINDLGMQMIDGYLIVDGERMYQVIRAELDGLIVREVDDGKN